MSTIQREGGWMQTFSGRAFYPLDPRVEEVDILDVAHSLACQNRYAGHAREPYSVAEHSVRCARLVSKRFYAQHADTSSEHERRVVLATLLHDSPEAYLVDLPRPVKLFMPDYRRAEARLAGVMELWAGLPKGAFEWSSVKTADETLLATEKRDLLGPEPMPWNLHTLPLAEVIEPWSWERAKAEFLALYEAVRGARSAVPNHYHHCPECYMKAPCGMGCTIFDSDDGVSLGAVTPCSDCAQHLHQKGDAT